MTGVVNDERRGSDLMLVGPTLHEVLAERAATTPEAVAIETDSVRLRYLDVESSACSVAAALRAQGVGPESVTAVCADRSPESVIAILAILKAGGAFLPLDPGYPLDRLAFMLHESHAALLLGPQESVSNLSAFVPTATTFDEFGDAPTDADGGSTWPFLSDNPAYVIFTSGSTGRPKGVAVTHGGLSNVIAAQREVFSLTPHDRVLQFASFSFDAAVFELALAFGSGGTLLLAGSDRLLPGDALSTTLDQTATTVLTVPPSTLGVTPEHGHLSLSTLIVAGEACSASVVSRWRQPGRRLFNAYGPTEVSIWATTDFVDAPGRPPIGRPHRNVDIFVLDDQLEPVRAGEIGEIFVCGPQLARGYINQASLTADRFVPSPIGRGQRVYRTGDLARVLPDGRLDFVGRADEQVKIRGFRVELGEVESRITAHPSIREAVVARVDVHATARLAAFYLSDVDVDPTEVRDLIAAHLPSHMIPATFTRVDAFPRTLGGKLDRTALVAAHPAPTTASVEGTTPFEQRLCVLYADVLMVDAIGVDDDFLDLGGDSLLAAELAMRLEEELGIKMKVRDIFDAGTVAALAAMVNGR
jgi:amino acid adenylation domain-containing protein